MHRSAYSRNLVILLMLLQLFSACSTATEASFGGEAHTPNLSIRELKSLGKGSSTPITREIRIGGVVTANDIRGEFPYAVVIEDATGGIEISVDHSFLCDLFPLGTTVTVHCNGLALGNYGGRIRLGSHPTESYSVDRIPRTEIGRYIRSSNSGDYVRRPRTRLISELTTADIDTYIRIEGICFTEQGLWCDLDPETGDPITSRRTITDATDNNLIVRISPSTHYATEPIPSGTGSVNGIVDYFNGEFSLRIVNYEVIFSTSAMLPRAYLSTAGYSFPPPTI